MKKGWRLLVGGNGGGRPRLSKELVRDISDDDAFTIIDTIISYYKENAKKNQRLGAMIEKLEFDTFKNEILGI
ncbi:NAD(P)/FAD-dependent oxidoreductase, partial [bacterium]|nr:NAD(P)/FAD-dependent oxidoreductase [bacterium]